MEKCKSNIFVEIQDFMLCFLKYDIKCLKTFLEHDKGL